MVQCIFIDISTADGCHVTFTDSSQGIIESFNITKPNSTESIIEEYITLSVSGNYTVIAYDIVNGIIIDTPSVVYHNVIQYISLYHNEAIHQRNSWCYILATVQYFPLMFDTAVCGKLSMRSIN